MTTTLYRSILAVYSLILVTIATLAYTGNLHGHLTSIPHYDTIGHVLLIGLFSLLLDGSLRFRPLPILNNRLVGLAPVLVIVAAGAEELLQSLSVNRSCTFSDFAADVFGVVLFATLARVGPWSRVRMVSADDVSRRPETRDPDPGS